MKDEEYEAMRIAEEKTADMLVDFAKSGRASLDPDQTRTLEECFEVSHCNEGRFPDISRRIECWILLRYCISRCDRPELKRIERTILEIAERVNIKTDTI